MNGIKTLVVITGPTASGKSDLAIDLACALDTEIVSADSRQMYREIPVGTAAPDASDLARVKHHFVGNLELEDYYSAALFEKEALKVLDSIWRHNDIAVMCGGSMLYIDAVTKGIDEMPQVSDATRRYVKALFSEHGIEGVLAQLQIVDPGYYNEADKANPRRIMHALEISLQSGKAYSSFRTGAVVSRPFSIIKFAINRSREDLFERINRRVDKMMQLGLEQEAKQALAHGALNSLNTVGYKEMRAYFKGEMDYGTTVARIAKNTRVYAKKQLTWLRKDDSVIWVKPETALEEVLTIIAEAKHDC